MDKETKLYILVFALLIALMFYSGIYLIQGMLICQAENMTFGYYIGTEAVRCKGIDAGGRVYRVYDVFN